MCRQQMRPLSWPWMWTQATWAYRLERSCNAVPAWSVLGPAAAARRLEPFQLPAWFSFSCKRIFSVHHKDCMHLLDSRTRIFDR